MVVKKDGERESDELTWACSRGTAAAAAALDGAGM